jgi:hypothetical protein
MRDLAAFLAAGGYEQLRLATRTHREDLVVRLCGEVGLQPGEIVAVAPDDVLEVDGGQFLRVGDREAFLPPEVAHDLRKFAQSTDGDGPLVDVSSRRVQMLVREVGARAAEATDDDRFREVSSRDLRSAHARQLLHDGVTPSVVLAVTAYDRLAALEPHLDTPDRRRIVADLGQGRAGPDDPPARLRRTVTIAADVGETLAAASTAADIRETVCERLADTDGYRFAWVAEATGDGYASRAAAGVAPDAVQRTLDDRVGVVDAALESREVRTVDASDATLVVIPLVGGDQSGGLLGIGAEPDEVGSTERDLLAALGAQVGHALAAVERKRLLLADAVTELTFRVGRDAAFLPAAAAALDSTFEVAGLVPVDDGLLCYVASSEATPDAVLDYAADADAVADARFVGDADDGVLLELTLEQSPALTLAGAGGRVRSYEVDPRGGRLVGEIAPDADVRGVVQTVTASFPGAHLDAKRETEREVATDAGFRETLADELTERQATALRAAYFGGYFEWPRDSTAEELADSLDVSSPTLHNHLRTAQQKLLRAFLEDT